MVNSVLLSYGQQQNHLIKLMVKVITLALVKWLIKGSPAQSCQDHCSKGWKGESWTEKEDMDDFLPDKFGRIYSITHCSKCFFINSCLTFSATSFQSSRSWAFPCQNCFPLLLSSPLSCSALTCFSISIRHGCDAKWRVCWFTCLQNNHSDAHYQNRCSS